MKTVVFGGSGFLGSHVADELTAQGHQVTVFDRVPSPYAGSSQRMVIGDIGDDAAVSEVLKGADYAYHLAGVTSLDDAQTKPLDTVLNNVTGTVTVLEAAVQAKLKRFIYASSVYVYSHLGGFYRCSKQAAELYVEEYQRRRGLEYTILRYGTIYGPRADEHNSVFRYLRDGLQQRKITFPGTGEELREYIHVRDAARLSVEILDASYANQPLIITGHHPMKSRDMLRMIQEILQQPVAVEFKVPADGSVHYTMTPYAFLPRAAKKLVSNCYVDMGHGLLECLHEITAIKRPSTSVRSRAPGRMPRRAVKVG